VFKGIDAKLVAVADGILKAGAQRDAETSKSISDLIVTADSGLTTLDGSVVREGGNMSAAARNAGIAASMSNYGAAGMITSAIAANRPIINVDVAISATKINEVTVVEDRGGSRSGSRDGDGGGGPGQ
jgi:hypothetical protein